MEASTQAFASQAKLRRQARVELPRVICTRAFLQAPFWRRIPFIIAAGLLACVAQAAETGVGPKSGLPLPRYVSLKPDRVNVRGGPTRDHEVAFVYTRAGLPVEITAESDNWRRIRDWEGSEGWVYHSLLSGKRTGVILPKDRQQLVPVHEEPDEKGRIVAHLQAGVLAAVKRCTGTWCRVTGAGFDGWVVQEKLWGVYANEKVD